MYIVWDDEVYMNINSFIIVFGSTYVGDASNNYGRQRQMFEESPFHFFVMFKLVCTTTDRYGGMTIMGWPHD